MRQTAAKVMPSLRHHKCADGAIVREVMALDGVHLVCRCKAYKQQPHIPCAHIEETKRAWGEVPPG